MTVIQTALGKLKRVNLRSVWKNEEYDFSKWLAQDENLQLLNEELGLQLVLKETEASVGRYSVDLLAIDDGTDKIAVIENQLEPTDHDHLGKLITYGAGLGASYLVWVVSDIRDEHLNAIEWINENSNDSLNFFLVKIELWQIDDSKPSPKFTTYAKPNDFSKNIKKVNSGEITKTKAKQLEFWIAFREFAQSSMPDLKTHKPSPQHWLDFSIGTSWAHCSFSVNTVSSEITCELYIDDNKELFDKLYEQKTEIEAALQMVLDWKKLPDKKASRILVRTNGNIDDATKQNEFFKWFIDTGSKFKNIFSQKIKELD